MTAMFVDSASSAVSSLANARFLAAAFVRAACSFLALAVHLFHSAPRVAQNCKTCSCPTAFKRSAIAEFTFTVKVSCALLRVDILSLPLHDGDTQHVHERNAGYRTHHFGNKVPKTIKVIFGFPADFRTDRSHRQQLGHSVPLTRFHITPILQITVLPYLSSHLFSSLTSLSFALKHRSRLSVWSLKNSNRAHRRCCG